MLAGTKDPARWAITPMVNSKAPEGLITPGIEARYQSGDVHRPVRHSTGAICTEGYEGIRHSAPDAIVPKRKSPK